MKLRNRVAAFAMATVMTFSLITVPINANAEKAYNKGDTVIIDTSLVPTDNGDISINSGKIKVNKNVKFTLDANVDVKWSATDSNGNDTSNRSNMLQINEKSGEVKVPTNAERGFYTIKAAAVNSSSQTIYNSPIIQVEVTDDIASATRVVLDEDLIEEQAPGQIDVIPGEKGQQKIVCTGAVKDVVLYSHVEPEYLYDDEYSFKEGTVSPFEVTGDDEMSVTKSGQGTLYAYAMGNQDSTERISVKTETQDFSFKLVSNQVSIRDKAASFAMNQKVDLHVEENSDIAMTENGYVKLIPNSISYVLTQGEETLIGTEVLDDEDNIVAYTYDVQGTLKNKTIGTVAMITVSEDNRNVSVETISDAITECAPVKMAYSYSTNRENSATSTYTFNFATTKAKDVTKISLDFDEIGVAYNKKQDTINKESSDVYYFERGTVIDLPKITNANESGILSFENSKENNFKGDNAAYKINYIVTSVTESNYDNTGLQGQLDMSNYITDTNHFKLNGTGYFKLTVSPNNKVDEVSYIIRVVSPAEVDTLQIKNSVNGTYDLDSDEVIHLRKGEAVTPMINGNAVTLTDPYLDYSFSRDGIVGTARDTKGNVRISGLKTGKVKVTVTGRADQSKVKSFYVYVNEDQYKSDSDADEFEISFSDAELDGKGETKNNVFVISGKQDEVPVGLLAQESSVGIPEVTWSLETEDGKSVSEDVAVIDSATGVISTKKATDMKIYVVATSVAGKRVRASISIAEVKATKIDVLSEKVVGTAKVESTKANSGTVVAGSEFTLYASQYTPSNATSISGLITSWDSSDETVATVDKDGNVKAIKAGSTIITANYSSAGNQTAIQYTLVVKASDVPVTSIEASDVVLTRIEDTAAIDVKVNPENATNKKVTYKSADEKVVKVNENGQLTAVGVGTTTVVITSVANPEITKTINVTVKGEEDKPIAKPDTPAQPTQPTQPTTQAPTTQAPTTEAANVTVSATKINSIKNNKSKKATLKFKKVAGAQYEISYGLKKNFKGAKTVVTNKTTYVLKKVKKGKTYYVRVRAFQNVNGTTYYSSYSPVKKVKIKK